MKKILLALLVMFGLQIQTQAQVSLCDSIEIIIVSSTPTEVILGTNISSLGIPQPATYWWKYYELIGIGSNYISGNGGAHCSYCTTDTTLNAMNQIATYSVMLIINNQHPSLLQCGISDTLSYNTITSQWELNSGSGNPTAITEIERNNVSDDRLYDLLGREFANYNSIPHNTIYIKNRKKYLKTR